MEIVYSAGNYIVTNASYLVGLVLPVIVEVLNKDVKGSRERFFITIFVCIFAGSLLHYRELLYGSMEDVATSIGIIFAESQLVFKLYFEKSWLRWKIQETIGVEDAQKPIG